MTEEYFDILDEKGNKTGKKKLRSEVHRDGDWHKAVYVWIVNPKGQILMQLRHPQKDLDPNMWDAAVAGHNIAGSDSLDTAVKEVKEEIGLTIDKNDLEYLFSHTGSTARNNGEFINNSFYDYYLLVKDIDVNKLKLQEEEVTTVKFIEISELERVLAENDEKYVIHSYSYPKIIKILKERFQK